MSEAAPIAVFVHVHYPGVWAEMAEELGQAFDRPFGLVLTCRDAAIELAEVRSPHLRFVRRIETENRGRDVLPFVRALREVGDGFEIGLKLHTKRSTHREDGERWRRHLTESLLRRDADGLVAPAAMEAVPALGLVAPDAHFLPLEGRMATNGAATRRVLAAIGESFAVRDLERRRFAAGSMFWFRRAALADFTAPGLDALFPREKGQLDGTAAHGAERLFAVVAERRGFLSCGEEGLRSILDAVGGGESDPARLQALADEAGEAAANPFLLPVPRFWRKYPRTLILAHHLYKRLPTPVWEAARTVFRRLTRDKASG